ncbi:MAG: EI24 domain-containing protein [Bacteroidota bacterium]
MRFFEELFKAIANCFRGLPLLFEKGLWPYLLYPVIMWVCVWAGSIWLFAKLATQITEYINGQLNFETIPDSGAWLSFAKPFLTGYFSIIIGWIIKLVFWMVSGTFIKYVLLILLSPLFSLLSESLEEKLTEKKFPFNGMQLLKDIFRGIGISLRNMILEYFFIAICFLLTLFVPLLAIVTVPLLFFISWYYIGFTMLDYNFERHKMTISQSASFTRKHKGTAIGIGIVYSFFMLLPLFMGLFFGPILAVVGATLCFLDIQQKQQSTPVQPNTL